MLQLLQLLQQRKINFRSTNCVLSFCLYTLDTLNVYVCSWQLKQKGKVLFTIFAPRNPSSVSLCPKKRRKEFVCPSTKHTLLLLLSSCLDDCRFALFPLISLIAHAYGAAQEWKNLVRFEIAAASTSSFNLSFWLLFYFFCYSSRASD